jgi:hypothetical protein
VVSANLGDRATIVAIQFLIVLAGLIAAPIFLLFALGRALLSTKGDSLALGGQPHADGDSDSISPRGRYEDAY